MILTKMIYIASPFTYKTRSISLREEKETARFYAVTEIIGKLQDKYPYAFIGPITQSFLTSQFMKTASTEFHAWELRDLTYISRCDELWVVDLPGWTKSKGVTKELEFALINDIPIKIINHETLKIKPLILK